MVGLDHQRMLAALAAQHPKELVDAFGDGRAASRVVEELLEAPS